jgi:hypothetical protein
MPTMIFATARINPPLLGKVNVSRKDRRPARRATGPNLNPGTEEAMRLRKRIRQSESALRLNASLTGGK